VAAGDNLEGLDGLEGIDGPGRGGWWPFLWRHRTGGTRAEGPLDLEPLTIAEDGGPFDDGREFPHIARPGVSREAIHVRRGRQPLAQV
jgi:hypothetical protein